MLAVLTISPGESSKKKEEESKKTTKLTPTDWGEMMRKCRVYLRSSRWHMCLDEDVDK